MRCSQSQWCIAALAVLAFAVFTVPARAQRRGPPRPMGMGMHGQIIRIRAPNQFIMRTPDNRQMILHTDAQTRFLLNERAARFSDLRRRSNVAVRFNRVGGRNLARSVTINPSLGPVLGAGVQRLEGTIVRVRDLDDLMLVRTAAGREVLLDIASRANLTINNQPALLRQFQPGMPVQIQFAVQDGKKMAQSVVVMPSPSP
jgi:hypothetical protein